MLLLVVTSLPLRADDEPPTTPLNRGREYTAWFHEGRQQELFARMSKALQDALKSAGALGRSAVWSGANGSTTLITDPNAVHREARSLATTTRLGDPSANGLPSKSP